MLGPPTVLLAEDRRAPLTLDVRPFAEDAPEEGGRRDSAAVEVVLLETADGRLIAVAVAAPPLLDVADEGRRRPAAEAGVEALNGVDTLLRTRAAPLAAGAEVLVARLEAVPSVEVLLDWPVADETDARARREPVVAVDVLPACDVEDEAREARTRPPAAGTLVELAAAVADDEALLSGALPVVVVPGATRLNPPVLTAAASLAGTIPLAAEVVGAGAAESVVLSCSFSFE